MADNKPKERKHNRVLATRAVNDAVEAYYEKCWADAEKGALTAWGEGIAYFPLIRAAGINYVFADAMSARMGARKFPYAKEAATDFGFLDETCSYSRFHIGASRILKGDFPYDKSWDLKKIMAPLPNVYFNTDACSAGNTWGELLRRYLNIPVFTVFTRRVFNQGEIPPEDKHVVEQLKEMVKFLEKLTGRPYDWDKLREILGILRQSAAMRARLRDLMKLRPAPLTYFDVLSTFASFTILHGLPEAPKLLGDVVKECEDRAAKGISGIKNEKYRLYWLGAMFWTKLGSMAEKFAQLDVTVVGGTYDFMFYPYPEEIDPDKPLETLAASATSCGYTLDNDGAAEIADFRLCKDLNIDGIVVYECHTCRMQSGSNHDRADYVARRLGVPITYVTGDFVDDAFYNEAQFDTRIEGLLEVIDARRRGK